MRILITGFISIFLITVAGAQRSDTLQLSLEQADSLFLVNNYALLAARFQVRSDSALIRQAKLWDNPIFSGEFGFNSLSDPKLSIGAEGQTAYSIDQVIKLAGKRNKNVRLATLNADYSEAGFQELMRTLKWQLHNTFIDYYFQKEKINVMQEQQQILKRIVVAYKSADSSGSVAHADYIRLAQLQLSLKNDVLCDVAQLSDLQQQLQQLLGISMPVQPKMAADVRIGSIWEPLSIQNLINDALAYRPDVRMTDIDRKSALANYRLQKALAVPDLHIGAMYDKNSGVVHNYLGLSVGVDLPFWNRNQGNIRSAALLIQRNDFKWQQQQNIVETEVISAFNKYLTFKNAFKAKELEEVKASFYTLIGHVSRNFTKGNITLLQFIDFFNSYSDNFNDQNVYYRSLYSALNDLEYVVGISLQNK